MIESPLFDDQARTYDALLVLSFGGPEGPADVMPFLENVTRGRGVPAERLAEVAEHYLHLGGISPINGQNRVLIAALQAELVRTGIDLPIYFGNRNWHPFVTDMIRAMVTDGVRRCLVFVTSAMSSYSGCRQYREDLERASAEIPGCDIEFDKIRVFYNHPGFIQASADLFRQAVGESWVDGAEVTETLFSAHSIPLVMARRSAYESQLREASALVADAVGIDTYRVVYQSRSGSPDVPWLEPDILDVIRERAQAGVRRIAVAPIGFISDHMEVLFDLDAEAHELCAELGLECVRVPTVGTHPRFVTMIRELIEERMSEHPERPALGSRGPNHDLCPAQCCLSGRPVPAPAA